MSSEISFQKSLLLVEDDRLILSTISNGLSRAGYLINAVESVKEAELWLNQNERPDLVILDVNMPVQNGLELVPRLGEMGVPFILLTAHSDEAIIAQATEMGAMGYLVKPVDIRQIIPVIETAISRAREMRNLRKSTEQLQSALDADRSVSVAIGIIMDQHCLNFDDASELIRKTARDKHLKLIELASNIVSSRETLNLRIEA